MYKCSTNQISHMVKNRKWVQVRNFIAPTDIKTLMKMNYAFSVIAI